jgi:hypothetical protein
VLAEFVEDLLPNLFELAGSSHPRNPVVRGGRSR